MAFKSEHEQKILWSDEPKLNSLGSFTMCA